MTDDIFDNDQLMFTKIFITITVLIFNGVSIFYIFFYTNSQIYKIYVSVYKLGTYIKFNNY